MTDRKYMYRMNRAVGVMNKGDQFTADPEDPMVVSLTGAGYADVVLMEEGDRGGSEVRGEPGDHPDRSAKPGVPGRTGDL